MPCNKCSTQTTMSYDNPFIKGSIMGMGIFLTDMVLRPQFSASNMMELVLFGVEGIVCDLIYGMLHENMREGSVNFKKSLVAGLTIWLSDFFLRPAFVNGIGMEVVKFLLQGILVVMVFNYSP